MWVKRAWAAGYGGIGNRQSIRGPNIGKNPVTAQISIMNWMQAVEDASKSDARRWPYWRR